MTGKNGSLLHFPSGGLQWMWGLWVWPRIRKGALASDGSNLQDDDLGMSQNDVYGLASLKGKKGHVKTYPLPQEGMNGNVSQ